MKIQIIILFLLLINSCSNEKIAKNSLIPKVDMLNPQWINFSDLVEDVHCIPLESSGDAFLRSSWNILKYKEFIYVRSLDDFSVFIFNTDGKFIKKSRRTGKGKIITPCDVFIDELKDQLCIIDETHFLKYYTLSGDFLFEEKLPFPIVKMIRYKDSTFIGYDGRFNKKSVNTVFYWNKANLKNHKEFLPMTHNKRIHNNRIPGTVFAKDAQSGLIFSCFDLNDTIYCSNPRKNKPFEAYLHMDFNDQFFTESKYPEKGFTDKEGSEFLRQKKYVQDITSFHCASGKLYFRLSGKLGYYCALDIKNNTLMSFNSLFDNLNPYNTVFAIQGNTENSLFFMFKRSELIDHYKKIKMKPSYPDIKKLISSTEKKNDWVVVIVDLKK